MKHIIFLALALIVPFEALGQYTVNFSSFRTDGTTAITNSLTGMRVPLGTFFLVQLYYGAAGASEGQLVSVTNSPIGISSAPGFFLGGTRHLDALGVCDLEVTLLATLQVRSWEASLGPTWESALANWCAGSGVLGKSSLFINTTGNPCDMPPGTPATLNGLRGFNLVRCLYITMQPVSRTVSEGEAAVFSVSVGGTGPFSYQWRFNGMDIAGATSGSYTVANAGLSDAGSYSVVVSNSFDSVTSEGATLTVNPQTTRLVTTFNDSGGGSLRDAIAIANSRDLILFAPVVRGKIRLTSGELFIDKPLSILGPGAAQLAISGNTNSRVFHVGPQGDVDIRGLTITEGRVAFGGSACGGGILNEGPLRLYDCMITSNSATGGTGDRGSDASWSIDNGLVSPYWGGSGSSAVGAGVYGTALLEIYRCTVLGNTCLGGTGGDAGNWCSCPDAFVSPGLYGGPGGRADGAGIFTANFAVLENCTIAGNRATGGTGGAGGLGMLGGPTGPGGTGGEAIAAGLNGSLVLRSCTVSDNSVAGGIGGTGGTAGPTGAALVAGINATSLDVMNTLIAGNTGSSNSPDIAGMITSLGWNLVGITDGSSGWTLNDFLGNSTFPLNALLGPCQDNGGPVWTMCPLTGSPARDKGQSVLATDARGGKRVVDFSSIPNAPGGNGSDIGALEVDSLFRILSLAKSNTFARVRFKTDAGTFYTLQQTSVVTNRMWTNLVGTVMGDGHALEITDSGPLPPTRFYRVRGE